MLIFTYIFFVLEILYKIYYINILVDMEEDRLCLKGYVL